MAESVRGHVAIIRFPRILYRALRDVAHVRDESIAEVVRAACLADPVIAAALQIIESQHDIMQKLREVEKCHEKPKPSRRRKRAAR